MGGKSEDIRSEIMFLTRLVSRHKTNENFEYSYPINYQSPVISTSRVVSSVKPFSI